MSRQEEFPYLDAYDIFDFPDPALGPGDGPICAGGNLSPGMVLSAYERGFFPWYSHKEPILWWSPDPRFVLKLSDLHFSSSLQKLVKKNEFTFTFDTAFDQVIKHCSQAPRPGQSGTWIVQDIQDSYLHLHRLGYAHSVETWLDGNLVAGLYGVALDSLFCGESMFSLVSNASKLAFYHLCQALKKRGIDLIDSQVHTDLFYSFGAREITRLEYLSGLKTRVKTRQGRLFGSWKDWTKS